MIPKPLHAVIFDMDGLLLDTERLYRSAIFAACAAQGHEMVDHLHRSLIGTPKDVEESKLMEHFGPSFDLERYHRACAEHFDDLCGTAVPLRPGVKDLLDVLTDASVPMAVATSTSRPKAPNQLARAGILEWFDAIVTRTDVNFGKPHPETYLKAAELLEVDPSRCLALEDSYNGVRSAAAAGMATIMIPDLLPPTAEMGKLCVAVLSSLTELRAHILRAKES